MGWTMAGGSWSFFRRSEAKKKAELAADQIYSALMTGAKLEIPADLHKDSPTAQAILVLRKRYADSVVTMLQSKSVVLSRGNAEKNGLSQQSWSYLDGHGYFPATALPPEAFFDAHAEFMATKGGFTPEQAAAEAQKERLDDTRIVLP